MSKLIIDAYNETDLWYKKPEFKNRVDPDGAAVTELLAANHKGDLIYKEGGRRLTDCIRTVLCEEWPRLVLTRTSVLT